MKNVVNSLVYTHCLHRSMQLSLHEAAMGHHLCPMDLSTSFSAVFHSPPDVYNTLIVPIASGTFRVYSMYQTMPICHAPRLLFAAARLMLSFSSPPQGDQTDIPTKSKGFVSTTRLHI